ncbi:MAG: hypothetical protein QM820_41650 [Minicystis sp.]
MLLQRLAEAVLEIDDQLLAVGDLNPLAQDVGVLVPLLLLAVELVEGRERLRIHGLVLEHLEVRGDGAVRILELVLVEDRDGVEDRPPLVRLGDEIPLLLVDPEQLAEAAGVAVELLQRRDRVRVLAVGVVHGAELGERVVDALHLVAQHMAEPQPEGDREIAIPRVVRAPDGRLKGRDERVPPAGAARRALDVLDALRVARRQLEGREEPLEGALRLLELRLVKPGDLAVQLELGLVVLIVEELDLDDGGQALGVARLLVERDERLGRREVLRVDGEDLLVGAGGAIGLALLRHPQLGDLHEQADLGLVVRLLRLLRLEDADELVPLAALGVEDLEIVPAAEREVLLLQRLLRLAILRVDREELPPRLDGLHVVVEALAVERAELAEQRLLGLDVEGDVDLLLQDDRERLEILGALVETGERVERLLVLRIVGDDLVPEVDADLRLLHALGGELGDLEELLPARRALRHVAGLALHQADELLPVAPLLVALAEELDGLGVLPVEREDRLEALHGLGRVGELGRVEVGGLRVVVNLLRRLVDGLGQLDQRLDVLVVALGLLLLRGLGEELVDVHGRLGRRRGRGRRSSRRRDRGRRSSRRRNRGRRGRRRHRRRRRGRRHGRRGRRRRRRRRCGSRRGLVMHDRLLDGRRRRAEIDFTADVDRHLGARVDVHLVARVDLDLVAPLPAQPLSDLRLERAQARVIRRDGREPLEPVARAHQVAGVAPHHEAGLRHHEGRVAVRAGHLLDELGDAIPLVLLRAPEIAQVP